MIPFWWGRNISTKLASFFFFFWKMLMHGNQNLLWKHSVSNENLVSRISSSPRWNFSSKRGRKAPNPSLPYSQPLLSCRHVCPHLVLVLRDGDEPWLLWAPSMLFLYCPASTWLSNRTQPNHQKGKRSCRQPIASNERPK